MPYLLYKFSMSTKKHRETLEQKVEVLKQMEELFEYLPDVYFFAKDLEGRFVMANQVFVEICGEVEEDAIIGKTDHDFFPRDRADLYIKDDKWVMETGESIVNRVELAPDPEMSLNLFVTSKIPMRDSSGQIIGIAGIARDMKRAKQNLQPLTNMTAVVEHIHEHFDEDIRIPDLAELAAMSISQFERKFKGLFQLTPQQYLIEIRLNRACKEIVNTDHTLSQIAHDSGFYDHSHFTRQFVNKFGITPREYRKKHY